MDFGEIMTYAATALGGGGIASVLNWRWNKRKAAAETKQDEVEVVRKIIEEVFKPTIDFQEKRAKEQQEEITELRKTVDLQQKEITELRKKVDDCADSRDECHKMLATLKDEIARLQRSRDNRGRYAKEFRPVTKEVKKDAVDA